MKIRMYKVGLGDCFLLAFPGEDRAVHVLVDCGVITGTPKAKETMRAVARDIADSTDGRLDVLAATHEHWDHLSGFLQAKEIFDGIAVGEVWLAWTEDPADSLARALREERASRLALLRAAFARWGEAGVQPGVRAAVASVLDFFGDPLAAAGYTTRAALDALRGRSGAVIRYLKPGQVVRIPGVRDARVFVLGPPREEKFLRKDLPTKTGKETYGEPGFGAEASGFFAALGIAAAPAETRLETPSGDAFDAHWRVGRDEARRHPFFRARYGFGREPSGDNAEWRRIDDDWLAFAGRLALDLDRDTNNTSLVLAIEPSGAGDVVLLAADAQVGNWESWHARTWTVDDGGATRTVTAPDLLARTVLYKAGHHGSHNATLREKGLEMMVHRGLTAMVPVDHAMAVKKEWRRIPFEPLLARLRERCRGRVVRIDTGVPSERDGAMCAALSPAERAAFREAVKETDLYVELTVPDGEATGPGP